MWLHGPVSENNDNTDFESFDLIIDPIVEWLRQHHVAGCAIENAKPTSAIDRSIASNDDDRRVEQRLEEARHVGRYPFGLASCGVDRCQVPHLRVVLALGTNQHNVFTDRCVADATAGLPGDGAIDQVDRSGNCLAVLGCQQQVARHRRRPPNRNCPYGIASDQVDDLCLLLTNKGHPLFPNERLRYRDRAIRTEF